MSENQMENLSINSTDFEPETVSDNSQAVESNSENVSDGIEGKSGEKIISDPSKLILGKFKSQEDLVKAYQDLEKLQGNQSAELGSLRQNAGVIRNIQQAWERRDALMNSAKELQDAANKYNTPEYFQDPSFKEMYKEAYLALGSDLDTDRFINLLESYVSSRIFAHERVKSAKSETQKAIGEMKFDKNALSNIQSASKRIDEMTPKEIDELLDRLI